MTKMKKFVLRAFNVTQHTSIKNSQFKQFVDDALKGKVISNNRRMALSNGNNGEKDFLSDFNTTDSYVFGLMMRIAPSKDIPEISSDLFNKEKIKVSDINSRNNQSFLCKDTFYFILNNDFVINTLPLSITIKRFQVYINWLIQECRGSYVFYIEPQIEMTKQLLNGIKKIRFSDPDNPINIVKAELIIKFAKPKKMEESEYKKALSATIKPISDIDNLTIQTNSGAIIKGQELLKSRTVEIELLDDGQINQKDLELEMEQFLYSLTS